MAESLSGIKVAIIATDMFEESEMVEPRKVLETAGAETELISIKGGKIVAANKFDKAGEYEVDMLLSEADPSDYDALLLPGGALNVDALRMVPEAQAFVKEFDEAVKPIAFICHAAWLLVSADLVKDRVLTSHPNIQDDIKNAGGAWRDEEVVEDANWVSSRQPSDIPAFNEAMINLFVTSVEETMEEIESEFAFGETIEEEDDEL